MASTPTVRSSSEQASDISEMKRNPRSPVSINVGQTERLISMVGGGLLALYGLGRRGLSGVGLALLGGEMLRRGITGHCYLYQALDISTYEERPTVSKLPFRQGVKVRRSMTILRSPEELYRFWRDVENAPQYMRHVRSVTVTGDRTSHWVAETPNGTTIEWDSEITQDIPNQLLAWRAVGKALTGSGGEIRFARATGNRGTVVTVEMDFPPMGGALGVPIETLLARGPEMEVHENLRRFKELMEAGEIATIKGQPVGMGQFKSKQGIKQ